MSSLDQTPTVVSFGEDVLERMVHAVLRVRDRLDRTASSLEGAAIPFAIGGSNAASIWIGSVDESAVRQARNVEVVLRRQDLGRAEAAFRAAGFIMSVADKRVRFLDGPDGKWRDGVAITFAGEPIQALGEPCFVPHPEKSEIINRVKVLRIGALVDFQLARYQLDDAVDLRDMIDVGLLDRTWFDRLQPELAKRLQELLDDPDG